RAPKPAAEPAWILHTYAVCQSAHVPQNRNRCLPYKLRPYFQQGCSPQENPGHFRYFHPGPARFRGSVGKIPQKRSLRDTCNPHHASYTAVPLPNLECRFCLPDHPAPEIRLEFPRYLNRWWSGTWKADTEFPDPCTGSHGAWRDRTPRGWLCETDKEKTACPLPGYPAS